METIAKHYSYRAVVCRPNGRWEQIAGEMTREARKCRDGSACPASPNEIPRLALRTARGLYPDAVHVFVLSTQLKKQR